jgi:hypothetical protein
MIQTSINHYYDVWEETIMDYKKLQNGSDIRGVALEGIEGQHVNLTEDVCKNIGRGFAVWLKDRLGKEELRVAVGRDSRLSGEMLSNWLCGAMCEQGVDVLGRSVNPSDIIGERLTAAVEFPQREDAPFQIAVSVVPKALLQEKGTDMLPLTGAKHRKGKARIHQGIL